MVDALTLPVEDASGYGLIKLIPQEGKAIFIAGGAITKGQAVMFDSNDGKVVVTDGSKKFIGIAYNTAATGEAVTVVIQKGVRITAESAGAIAVGDDLIGAASGRVAKLAAAGTETGYADVATDINNARLVSAKAVTTVTASAKEVEIMLV